MGWDKWHKVSICNCGKGKVVDVIAERDTPFCEDEREETYYYTCKECYEKDKEYIKSETHSYRIARKKDDYYAVKYIEENKLDSFLKRLKEIGY